MWRQYVLDRFERVSPCRRASTWKARCPAHDDRSPSLTIWVGRKGFLLVRCWAGRQCSLPAILGKVGLRMSDLFPPEQRNAYGVDAAPRPARRAVATYPYCDEEGLVLYEKLRYEPKDFRQRAPDGRGGWRWSLDGVRRVPFLLPELLARPGWPVLLVEGEKDALAAHALGLVATCATEGAGSGWDDDTYPAFLRGRRVAIIPDNDRPGMAHAERVCGVLLRRGAGGVRLVELPGLAEHGDLSDWLAAGGTRDDLLSLIRAVPEWRPA